MPSGRTIPPALSDLVDVTQVPVDQALGEMAPGIYVIIEVQINPVYKSK
jgi:hypothetical protein